MGIGARDGKRRRIEASRGRRLADRRFIGHFALHQRVDERHFFALRCCNRAQWEINEMACCMLDLVKKEAPTLFTAAGPACAQAQVCPAFLS